MSAARMFHSTIFRRAVTSFNMPAMSPTMSEGGIASWKIKEGGSFSAGDVLLEIETDKATIDVEAQDDGILGKILMPEGSKNVPVGKTIAILAEEGDDITNIEAPQDVSVPFEREASSHAVQQPPAIEPTIQQTPPLSTRSSHSVPTHSRPLFPSVQRLLLEHNIDKLDKISGTGVRGMLTKGDVLAFLGKASSPTGTFKLSSETQQQVLQPATKEELKPLDGPSLRRLIVSSMLQSSIRARSVQTVPDAVDFDLIIADYLPAAKTSEPSTARKATKDYFGGLL